MHALMLRFVVHEGATSAVAGRPRDDETVVWQNAGDDICPVAHLKWGLPCIEAGD